MRYVELALIQLLGLAVIANVTAAEPSHSAVESTSASCGPTAQYVTEMREAVAANAVEKFLEARKHFECAHALDASARTWLGMALVSVKLGEFERADQELDEAISNAKRALSPAECEDLKSTRQQINAHLASLRVEVAPREARLFVDDVERHQDEGGALRRLRLTPGKRDLRAEADSYSVARKSVELTPGKEQTLSLRLQPLSPDRTLPIVVGSVGVLGVALSATFGILSVVKHNQSETKWQTCRGGLECTAEANATRDTARAYGTLTDIALIVGLAGLGAATVLWFTVGTSADADRPARGVAVGLGAGQLQLRGQY